MQSQPFLQPKLVGARFEGHEIPLEFLKDFAAFEEFVIEVARWHFFTEHPDRTRSPRGFLQGVSLRLASVDPGSAIARIVLSLAATSAPMLFSPDNDYLAQSRNSIVAAIGAAQNGKPVTEYLPEKLLGYFQVFGRSLRDDEAIEFPLGNETARLTKETRRKLLSSIKNVVVTDTAAVVGKIPEADQEKGTFQLQVGEDKRFASKDFARHRENILLAFNGYHAGAQVRLRGVCRFNEARELQGIEEVTSVDIIEPLDITLRIEEHARLEDGWFDGEGKELSVEGAAWLAVSCEFYYSARLALPHLYPTLTGGVRAEWSLPNKDVSLEIDIDARKGNWHELDLTTDAEETKSVDLSNRQDWEWIVNRISELGGVRDD